MNIAFLIAFASIAVSCFLTFYYIPKRENDEKKNK